MELQKKISDSHIKMKILLKNKEKNFKKIKKDKIPSNKSNSFKLSVSSNENDIDKQNNLSTKKIINGNDTTFPKIIKRNSQKIVNINKRLINDLNYQIKNTNKKIFENTFIYKQTINLQELNDYIIYEQTKKNIINNKNKGIKNSVDFRIPLVYRRLANHCKREDLIPMKIRPRINLDDILINHNSIFRKSMSQNRCQKYYLKNSVKLMYNTFKNNMNPKKYNN